MIQITPQMRILVAVDPVDFRAGIDGLARLCQQQLGNDPFSGTLFVFRNRGARRSRYWLMTGEAFGSASDACRPVVSASGRRARTGPARSWQPTSCSC